MKPYQKQSIFGLSFGNPNKSLCLFWVVLTTVMSIGLAFPQHFNDRGPRGHHHNNNGYQGPRVGCHSGGFENRNYHIKERGQSNFQEVNEPVKISQGSVIPEIFIISEDKGVLDPTFVNKGQQEQETIKLFRDDESQPKTSIANSEKPVPKGGCQEGFGINKATGKCNQFSHYGQVDDTNPCGTFMEFYKDPTNPMFGICDCKEMERNIQRPIVYWEQTDKCYWVFDQGPCTAEHWLVLDDRGLPSCTKRTCPENPPTKADENGNFPNQNMFWVRNRGQCYQTETKANCEDPGYKLFYEHQGAGHGYTLKCKGFGINVKALLSGVKSLPCEPGHKRTISGDCDRVVKF